MTDSIRKQLKDAGVNPDKALKSSGKTSAGSRGSTPRRKGVAQQSTAPTPTDAEEELEYVPSSEPVVPQPRFYRSTATVEGLGSARLVGFTEAQWAALVPLLTAAGFRPY